MNSPRAGQGRWTSFSPSDPSRQNNPDEGRVGVRPGGPLREGVLGGLADANACGSSRGQGSRRSGRSGGRRGGRRVVRFHEGKPEDTRMFIRKKAHVGPQDMEIRFFFTNKNSAQRNGRPTKRTC